MKKLKGLIVGMLLCSSLVSVGSSFAATPKKVSPKVVTQTKDTFIVKNSQIELGTKWSAENNFEKATDTDGKALTWKKISKDVKVNGEVDTEKIGTYEVVYEYAKKKEIAKIEVIEAKKKKTKEKEVKPVENGIKEIKSKNITIPQGSKFEPSSVFIEAIKNNGEVASWQEIAEKVKVTDSVDTTKVGTYKVTYALGEVTTTSEVTVVAVPTEIKLKPITIENSGTWNPVDSFDSVVMSDGSKLDWKAVSAEMVITGNDGSNILGEVVNTKKAGTYKVSYLYQGQTGTTTVTVKEAAVPITVKKIELKDTTIEVGSKWEASNNFVKVVMSDDTELAWKDVSSEMTVTGNSGTEIVGEVVNTAKAGVYKVSYLYKGETAIATVTVKEKAVPVTVKKIELKDTTIEVGSKWEASNNFVKVVMSDDTELAWKDVSSEMTVTGNSGTEIASEVVNTAKAGAYKVSYLYKGETATAIVTVKEKAVPVTVKKIELKDTSIEVGSKWEASNNFVKVTMSDGKELAWKDVSSEMTVTGNTGTGVVGQVVDTTKAGAYKVSYLYKGETAIATVTVKEKAVPVTVKKIELKDTAIEVGSKWEASNNFVKVTMSDGKELAWKDVSSEMTVTGNTGTGVVGQVVNTTKAGTYTASYLYKGTTATAKITVVEKKKQLVPVNKKILPQTGENLGIGTVISGLLLLIGVFLTIRFKMKKIEDN